MATPGASIGDRISDIIGSDYSSVPDLSYKDLINAAFNEVADMVNEEPINLVCVTCSDSATLDQKNFKTLANVATKHRVPLVILGTAFNDPKLRKKLSHKKFFANLNSIQNYLIRLSSS